MNLRFALLFSATSTFLFLFGGCDASRPPAPSAGGAAPQVAAPTAQPAPAVATPAPRSLLQNGAFHYGLSNWLHWMDGARIADSVQVITGGVRLLNPAGKMVGIRQTVSVESGAVYRLSGVARSLVTNDSKIGFGARLAFFLPPQQEVQIIWMSEYNQWWPKELVFTNQITGTATIYAHLGFGGYATTGEISCVMLEKLR
jgi:hypothetical protein